MRGKTNRDTIKTLRIEIARDENSLLIPLTFANFQLSMGEQIEKFIPIGPDWNFSYTVVIIKFHQISVP